MVAVSYLDRAFTSSTSLQISQKLMAMLAEEEAAKVLANSVSMQEFECPMSMSIMRDPVIIESGITYERAEIQRWFDAGHNTCPVTCQVLPNKAMWPNIAVRSSIARWRDQHQVTTQHG